METNCKFKFTKFTKKKNESNRSKNRTKNKGF